MSLCLQEKSLIWIECAAKFHLAYEFIFLNLYIDFYGWKFYSLGTNLCKGFNVCDAGSRDEAVPENETSCDTFWGLVSNSEMRSSKSSCSK